MNRRLQRVVGCPVAAMFPAVVVICPAALPSSASAGFVFSATVSWDGSCGNSFWASQCGSMTNWNNDQQTTLGDNVSIGPGDPVVNIIFDAQANSLTCESGLWIDAALELAGNGSIRDLTLSSIAQRALKINAGQVTLTGTTAWQQGRVGGAGVLRNESVITGAMHLVDTVTFVNAADVNATHLSIDAGAGAINTAGRPFALINGGSMVGLGLFTNHGDYFVDPVTNSNTIISAPYVQDNGSMFINSLATANASVLFQNDATFSGGQFTIGGDAHVRMQDPGGVGAVYTFDGLPAITGAGNLHLEIPFFGLEVRVTSDLNVNLTGTDGLFINSKFVTLGAELRNLGKARLFSGTIRELPRGEGISIPQLSNESGGTMRLNGSGVTLDTWLRNKSGGYFLHETGGLLIDDDGVVTNEGVYEHRRGTIARAQSATFGSFDNRGIYVRPDHPNTMSEQVSAPFVLSPNSNANFEVAETNFAGQIGSGLFFQGGDAFILASALVRVASGHANNSGSQVAGEGQFHIGGLGATTVSFDVNDSSILWSDLGPDPGDDGDLAGFTHPGGLYLDTFGRVGGNGRIENRNQFAWNGGVIGALGRGRVENARYTELNSGNIDGANASFVNADNGMVEQFGTLTITNGSVNNFGDWWVYEPVTIQSFGTGIFRNHDMFGCDAGLAQVVSITARFDNLDTVLVNSGRANFSNVVQVTGTTLTGGTWIAAPGATLDLPGNLTTIAAGATVYNSGTFSDQGTINSVSGYLGLGGVNWDEAIIQILNGGTLRLENLNSVPNLINNGTGTGKCIGGSYAFQHTAVVPSVNGRRRGDVPLALVCASFNNEGGTVGPGGFNTPGPFKMDGNFNQTSAGTLQIELGGATPVEQHDQLIVDGNVTVDGTLSVRVLPGFSPTIGQQFTIITATNGTISGTFDQINGFGSYGLTYASNAVTLTVNNPPEPGDTNGDGVVNVTDLLRVISQWGLCPAAPTFCSGDLNGDGLVNVTDLLLVISNWG